MLRTLSELPNFTLDNPVKFLTRHPLSQLLNKDVQDHMVGKQDKGIDQVTFSSLKCLSYCVSYSELECEQPTIEREQKEPIKLQNDGNIVPYLSCLAFFSKATMFLGPSSRLLRNIEQHWHSEDGSLLF